MTTRYLSIFLPQLPTDRLKRQAQARSGSRGPDRPPLATVTKLNNAQRIVAIDTAAAEVGIKPSMTLSDARAICPALLVAEADPAAEADTATHIVDWCRRFTPLTAPDGTDGVLLDIGGVAHLFDGEARLLETVERGLARQGFSCFGAIADTPEAAWALARFAAAGQTIVPPTGGDGLERLVAELPMAALRLDAEMVRAMAQAGLRRVGDLMMRPRAPITARFGPRPFARLDGLFGRTKSSITPRFEAPAYLAERRFASGITQQGDVEAALLPLARHLCVLLSRRNEGAREVEATLFRVDGEVRRIAVGTSRPTRDPDAIMTLLRERIAAIGEDGLDTGYGFDLIRLGVSHAEPLKTFQNGLIDDPDRGSGDLAELIDRLGARLGLRRVLRVNDQGSHIPEFAVMAVPAAHAAPAASPAAQARETPSSRPIRLFERPEPIDTIAAVPDGPPLRFRWRRVTHEIAAIEGPERIAPEWWRTQSALTRDYFRAEDREGRRFWLFREGLFNQETMEARWFLHGLFG